MKEKVFKTLELLSVSLFYLIITYTLSGMYVSFKYRWFAILIRAADFYALWNYLQFLKRITNSKLIRILACAGCIAAFVFLCFRFGYIKGEFTPFTRIF